jgi:uncharacterized HhH-GPD family protein
MGSRTDERAEVAVVRGGGMTSVLLVDDHSVVRAGLAALLGSAEHVDVVAQAADGQRGAELAARLRALPGFGDQKVRIFVALLGKQFGVRPSGWEEAAGAYATPGRRSVADVVDAASLQEVRDHKRAMKQAARQG